MNPFEGLPAEEYKCIVVDPPWQYSDTLPGERGAEDKYDGTASFQELQLFLMPQLLKMMERDAHVWMWATNSFMQEAHELCWALEAKPKTILTWCKPQIGMGRYLRNTTEHCILAVRGTLPSVGPKGIPSHFTASRARHSRKPDEAYDIIRAISPGPRIDLFARSPRVGFDRWGNQLLVWDGMKYVESPERFLKAGT